MKKISSEIKFNNNFFKLKVGTINKKKPETIYIEIGTYLTPSISQESFSDNLNFISKKLKQCVKSTLIGSSSFSKDFIFINEAATERMNIGKKSYFEIQIYLKPLKKIVENEPFKKIATNLNKLCVDTFIPCLKNNILENGYLLSKTKI